MFIHIEITSASVIFFFRMRYQYHLQILYLLTRDVHNYEYLIEFVQVLYTKLVIS